MQLLTTNMISDQDDLSVIKHHFIFCVYKKWPGRIIEFPAANQVTVEGHIGDFLTSSSGDKIIISTDSLDTEYEIQSYTASGAVSTITCTNNFDNTDVNLPKKDFVWLKFDLSDYIIDSQIGDIRKYVEDISFGALRPYQLNINLIDDNSEYTLWGDKTNPGIFFKDSLRANIVAVSTVNYGGSDRTVIQLTSGTLCNTYADSLATQYEILMTSGVGRNKKSKIYSAVNSGGYDNIYLYDDISDDIAAGDELYILMRNKFYCKAQLSMKNYPNNYVNIYFGVIYPKNITRANRRIDLNTFSLIKDFETQYAFNVSDFNNKMPGFPGTEIYSYNIGNKRVEEQKLYKAIFKQHSGNVQSVNGCKINSASIDTGFGPRLLRYKHPNQFQWDGGSWSTQDSEATGQTITASDGSTINCDFRPTDYSPIDCEDIVFMTSENKQSFNEESRGPASIEVDDGGETPVLSKFFRVWVDKSYVSGTINDESDINDVSNDEPIELVPVSANHKMIYFSSAYKFNAFEIRGLLPKNESPLSLTWEYSLAFGNDPDCFESLTVTDGTNGFSQDGVISFDLPDKWGKKSKVGESTEYHMYHIRVKIAVATTTAIDVDAIIPYTLCFGSELDQFVFKSDYRLFLEKGNYNDDIIIKYDLNDNTLKPSTWKQCIRVKDLLDELIGASGYGINIDTDDVKIMRDSPVVNVWGKPFTIENRLPTAMCIGSGDCNGYIFACFKNSIFRLKDHIWEQIATVDWNYTLDTIHFYGDIDESTWGGSSSENFIIAMGYKDVSPKNSIQESDYFVQPDMIMVRIDGVDGNSMIVTKSFEDNGGSILGPLAYTDGDGFIDTKFIIRSGHTRLISGNYISIIGSVEPSGLPGLYYAGENIVIPFEQKLMRLNYYSTTSTEAPNDLEYDVVALDDVKVISMVPDAEMPITTYPGFYFAYVVNVGANRPDMGLRLMLGQDGGNCRIYWPGDTAVVEYGIFGQSRTGSVWADQRRRWRTAHMYYGEHLGANQLVLIRDLGCGLFPRSSFGGDLITSNEFFARTEMLCAKQLPADSDNYTDYVVTGTYLDFYCLNGTNLYNEKRLEIMSDREAIGAELWPDEMEQYYYDNSLASGSVYSSWNNVTLEQNDYFVIADYRKFAKLLLQGTITGTVSLTIEMSYGSSSWFIADVHLDNISGGSGSFTGEIDFPMDRRWAIDTISTITDKYLIKITQTGSGSLSLTNFGIKRREIWNSRDIDFWNGSTKDYDFCPLEIEYNEYDGYIYGCVLDLLTLEYSVFCYGGKDEFFTGAYDTSVTMDFEQLTNNQLQPVGFVYNPGDSWIYFVAADRKYKKESAQLWRMKRDTSEPNNIAIEKLSDLIPGEWDCPTKLTCDGSSIYGFTGPNLGYFWEWSTEFYIRVPYANFGNSKIKDAVAKVCEISDLLVHVDEDAKTIAKKRYQQVIDVPDKIWDENHVINIEFIRESNATKSGILVSWQSVDGEFSGDMSVGETSVEDDFLTINNSLIQIPQTALIVAEELWKNVASQRFEVEGTVSYLYQHQLFDIISARFQDFQKTKDYGLTDADYFQLKTFTLSWKRKNARFVIIQNKNYNPQEFLGSSPNTRTVTN